MHGVAIGGGCASGFPGSAGCPGRGCRMLEARDAKACAA
ncbi:hypothetical protein ASZ90_002624 [hydrocarbon metagenome]|uniref:Uncharacterized protein n=1 Tax=hydrocarbon metagenome TaxID=938273 RepID=A0A0W8G2W9_9ZZZZ